jgi:type IV secretory pathway TraG/TraD family ATPase VirD4
MSASGAGRSAGAKATTPGGGAGSTWGRIAERVGATFGEWLDRVGAEVPIRPRHVRYPTPPRNVGTVVGKSVISLALFGVLGLGIGTSMVASAAHDAPELGKPVSPGFYFPTDLLTWGRFDHAPLARKDAEALRRVGADPEEVHAAFGVAFTVAWWALGGGLVLAGFIVSRPARIPKDLAGLKGTAEWASYRDVERADLLYRPGKRGIYLGTLERPPAFGIIKREPVALVYSGPRHVMQIAASRSGKDVGTNTYTGVATWPESIIWNDPKGEGHLQTSGVREALYGNEIVRFAPGAGAIGSTFRDNEGRVREERFGSTCWNPLEEIALGTDMEFSEMLQAITMVVDPTGKQMDGDNGHWFKTSRIGIKAIACKVLYDPLEPIKSLSRVADIFGGAGAATSDEHAGLQRDTDGPAPGSIEELLEQYLGFSASGFGTTPAWLTRSVEHMRLAAEREIMVARSRVGVSMGQPEFERFEAERRRALDQRVGSLERELRHPDLERDLRTMLRIKGEEASSVYSTINANLTPWLDPLVMRNTARCDARIEDVVNRVRPVTWYNVSPINRADMMRPIIKLWYTMAHRKLVPDMDVDRATKRSVSPWRHPCIWLMNERGSLGVIEIENESVPVAASYGFIFDTLVQGTGQLKEIGGEQKILEANSGVQVFHTPQDPEEQEALSKRLGNKTVLIENTSYSQGHMTRSWQTEQMPLMTPDQVALIPTEPRFKKRANGELALDADGVPHVEEPAYQLIWAPNCPAIYARKSQWFTNARIKKLIASIPSVIPKPLNASQALAEAYAIQEQVRSTPHRPETETRRKARVSESIAMRRLDPDDGGPNGTGEPPSADPSPSAPGAVGVVEASEAPDGGGNARGGVGVRKKRRVIAFEDRVIAKKRAQPDAAPAAGFEAILGPDQGRSL